MASIDTLSQLVGRPVGDLTLLDERLLAFAFVEGTFTEHTLRIGSTNEIVRMGTASNGESVDLDELRQLSAQRVAHYSARMSPELRSLVERHPNIERLRVRIVWIDSSIHGHESVRILSVRELTSMLGDSAVRYVQLADDPEVLDDD